MKNWTGKKMERQNWFLKKVGNSTPGQYIPVPAKKRCASALPLPLVPLPLVPLPLHHGQPCNTPEEDNADPDAAIVGQGGSNTSHLLLAGLIISKVVNFFPLANPPPHALYPCIPNPGTSVTCYFSYFAGLDPQLTLALIKIVGGSGAPARSTLTLTRVEHH